jgi:hypothetical protein
MIAIENHRYEFKVRIIIAPYGICRNNIVKVNLSTNAFTAKVSGREVKRLKTLKKAFAKRRLQKG